MASTSLAAQPRPELIRRDTDHILSYYQSEDAGRPYDSPNCTDDVLSPSPLKRSDSLTSNSASEYSTDSHPSTPEDNAHPRSQHRREGSLAESAHVITRRPSVPSEGGSDRRRLAIVEMDPTAPLSISYKRSGFRANAELEEHVSASPSGLLTRRGLQVNGLALIAPPDASPKTYTDLTPPPTAPIVGDRTPEALSHSHHQRSASDITHSSSHGRLHHKSSRDIGIVAGGMYSIPERAGSPVNHNDHQDGLKAPVFQTPMKSRSPSPAALTPELSDSATSFNESSYPTPPSETIKVPGLRTPSIGEEKDVGQPVVGPVVVGLAPDDVMRRQQPQTTIRSVTSSTNTMSTTTSSTSTMTPLLFYQPGLDAKAGPLPPPPRSIFEADNHRRGPPPPRPPRLRTPAPPRRDLEALKESLQLPSAVSTALSRSSSGEAPPEKSTPPDAPAKLDDVRKVPSDVDTPPELGLPPKSTHRREGAFPPSSSTLTPTTTESSIPSPISDAVTSGASTKPTSPEPEPPVVLVQHASPTHHKRLSEPTVLLVGPTSSHQEKALPTPVLHHEHSSPSLRQEALRGSSSSGSGSISGHGKTMSRSSSIVLPPNVPAKPSKVDEHKSSSGNPFKALTNFKRFSALPRAPSALSMTPSSTLSSRTPSPSVKPTRRLSPRPKTKCAWPSAMQYNDVTSRKNPMDRCRGYADKINELSNYDCGLSEWMNHMKCRGSGTRPPQAAPGPIPTPSVNHSPQPRHTSHGSMNSEATFPTRSDAYTATDLAMRPIDDLSSTKSPPPSLPYPSLAGEVRSPPRPPLMMSHSAQRYQVPLATGKSSGGFFSSIGRKASLKKDPKPTSLALIQVSPSKALIRRPQGPPKAVQLTSSPTVPGGPRTAPGAPPRVSRSQTISVAPEKPSVQPHQQQEPPSRRNTQRQSIKGRRPSIFGRASNSASSMPSNPEFDQQVNKLADLLPHVDRRILAGYLRRAGQDVLAIGQYLEDEKNGTIRQD